MKIPERFEKIKKEIENFSYSVNRSTPPQIIAVSKYHTSDAISEAINSGMRIFGESRINEGLKKFTPFFQKNIPFELHHIGPLQKGSLRNLLTIYSYTHGAGSISSIQELLKQCLKKKYKFNYFLQLNLTAEDTKSGFSETDAVAILKKQQEFNNDYCTLCGLMTMGPSNMDEEISRKVFQKLCKIRNDYFANGKLSMGMSGDYKIAIAEGADYVRIGTAIFGEREA